MDTFEAFKQDGIVVVPNAVPTDIIDRALEETERVRSQNFDLLQSKDLLNCDRLFRVVNFHILLPGLRKIFTSASEESMRIADTFGKATVYTSLYFEMGSEQTYHRDTPYFWTNPPLAYLGMWVALEDVDEENGPLQAIPGSHKLGEPDVVELRKSLLGDAECPPSHPELFNAYNELMHKKALENGLVPLSLPVKKGDVIFWDASTLHGGMAHLDKKRSRKSYVMHLTARDVPVMHMNNFFHPEKPVRTSVHWTYLEENGREFGMHEKLSFMHRDNYQPDQFDSDYKLKAGVQ